MEKKIFAYVGSRNPDSRLTLYVRNLLNELAKKSDITYSLYTAYETNINHSTGCKCQLKYVHFRLFKDVQNYSFSFLK
jgi:hypothetical protein